MGMSQKLAEYIYKALGLGERLESGRRYTLLLAAELME